MNKIDPCLFQEKTLITIQNKSSPSKKLYLNKNLGSGINIKEILGYPINIYWKNKNHFYLGCNDSAAESIGCNSWHDTIGSTIYDFCDISCSNTII